MSFSCPVALCRHHKETPFTDPEMLQSHLDSCEHVFIEEWEKGPAPPQIDDIGPVSVVLFWSRVPGATHYELQLKQLEATTVETKTNSTESTEDSWTIVDPSWTTVSSTLTTTLVKKNGLIPGTTYIFRYRTRDNQTGCVSPYSSPSNSIATLGEHVQRLNPPTLFKNGKTSTSLTITWDRVDEAATNGYSVQLRQVSFPPLSWVHAANLSGNAMKKNGLLPTTKYEFRVGLVSAGDGGGVYGGGGIVYSAPSTIFSTTAVFNPFKQLLGPTLIQRPNNKLLSNDSVLKKIKLVFLYFSASWCPPCKQFTPMLAAFYNEMKNKKNRSLEIIFVSADRDIASFQQYFNEEHPWKAIPYDSPNRSQASAYFKVNGIPKLMVFNGATGAIVCDNAVQQPLTEASLDKWEKL